MKLSFSRRSKNDDDTVPLRRSRLSLDNSLDDSPSLATYRRNRTITGSLSSRVASSNELNADLRSPRTHVHHLSRMRRRLFGYFLLLLVGGVMLYMLIGQLIASVTVTASSAATISLQRKQEYINHMATYFDKHPLERSLFTVNEGQLLRFVAAKYPEVSAIRLDSSGIPGRVNAYVTIRKAIAKWSLAGHNEFVDTQGVVFSYNAFETPALQIVDASGTATASGIVTSNRFLAFVGRVVGAARAQGYHVNEAFIPLLTTRQLEVKVEGVPYRIKYTIDRTAGEQAEDMARMIRYLSGKGISPSYVDVRTEGRAAYR